jgi:hypothetical protein
MDGNKPSGSAPDKGEFVGVTDTGRFDLDQDLAGARTVELDGGNFEGLAGCKGDGGANIHDIVPRLDRVRLSLAPEQ